MSGTASPLPRLWPVRASAAGGPRSHACVASVVLHAAVAAWLVADWQGAPAGDAGTPGLELAVVWQAPGIVPGDGAAGDESAPLAPIAAEDVDALPTPAADAPPMPRLADLPLPSEVAHTVIEVAPALVPPPPSPVATSVAVAPPETPRIAPEAAPQPPDAPTVASAPATTSEAAPLPPDTPALPSVDAATADAQLPPPEAPSADAPVAAHVTEAPPVSAMPPPAPEPVATAALPPPPPPPPPQPEAPTAEPARTPPPRPAPPRATAARQAEPRPRSDRAPGGGAAEAPGVMAVAAQPAVAPPGTGTEPLLVTAPRYRRTPRPPDYPARALEFGLTGTVTIRALVSPEGDTQETRLWRSSGHPLLDAAALAAVRRWAFEPARHAGRAVPAWVEVPVHFRLN